MLSRNQLLLLTAMATLGGSFAGLLAVGMMINDFTFAMINLAVIVALFGILFTVSGDKPKQHKRAGDLHVGGEVLPEFNNANIV